MFSHLKKQSASYIKMLTRIPIIHIGGPSPSYRREWKAYSIHVVQQIYMRAMASVLIT